MTLSAAELGAELHMAGLRAVVVRHVLRVKLRRVFTREIEGGEDFAEENLDVTAKANTTKQSYEPGTEFLFCCWL